MHKTKICGSEAYSCKYKLIIHYWNFFFWHLKYYSLCNFFFCDSWNINFDFFRVHDVVVDPSRRIVFGRKSRVVYIYLSREHTRYTEVSQRHRQYIEWGKFFSLSNKYEKREPVKRDSFTPFVFRENSFNTTYR